MLVDYWARYRNCKARVFRFDGRKIGMIRIAFQTRGLETIDPGATISSVLIDDVAPSFMLKNFEELFVRRSESSLK